ncbi:MAG: hypothetical protein IJL59_06785 [Clostridia bacterium]|nr:hypothetical protein [Clostridia bacterium]
MENRKLWIMGTVLVALVLVLGVLLSCAYGLYLTEQTAFRPAPAYYQTTQPTLSPTVQVSPPPAHGKLPIPQKGTKNQIEDAPLSDYTITDRRLLSDTTEEPVDLNDLLLVYEANGIVYAYLHGYAYSLFSGMLSASMADEAHTVLFALDAKTKTLYRFSLTDPAKPAEPIETGVQDFTCSADGNVLLMMKKDDADLAQNGHGEPSTTYLMLRKSDGIKRLDGSERVDQFYLTPDGRGYAYYTDCDFVCSPDGESETRDAVHEILYASPDLKAVVYCDGKTLFLASDGATKQLSETGDFHFFRNPGAANDVWWEGKNGWYHYDGTKTTRFDRRGLDGFFNDTPAYAYMAYGNLVAGYGDGEPVKLLPEKDVYGYALHGNELLVWTYIPESSLSASFARYTVDGSGVAGPFPIHPCANAVVRLGSDDLIFTERAALTDGRPDPLLNLYDGDRLVLSGVDRYNAFTIRGDYAYIGGWKSDLYRFDGETLELLFSEPLQTKIRDDGTILCIVREADAGGEPTGALQYFDGETVHRLASGVSAFGFARTHADTLSETVLHE